jgi:hypothetical protein
MQPSQGRCSTIRYSPARSQCWVFAALSISPQRGGRAHRALDDRRRVVMVQVLTLGEAQGGGARGVGGQGQGQVKGGREYQYTKGGMQPTSTAGEAA